MNHVCVNGKFLVLGQPVLAVDNKGYRYGDGVFETIKVYKSQLLLEDLHFHRFFSGLQTLGFIIPAHLTAEKLKQQILQLCEKNRAGDLARVRLTAYRGNGGIYDGEIDTHYTIECWPLTVAVNRMNENGLVIGIYPDARKSVDMFARIKSSNYLPYVMAAHYAKQKKWNDCLVLNTYDRIADASIANLFIILNGKVITPPLSEGGIAGVMRAHLLSQLSVTEMPVSESDLLQAEEIFLTNAISGIRWVKEFNGRSYIHSKTVEIFDSCIKTFYR